MRVIGSWLVIIAGMLLSIWLGFCNADEISIGERLSKLSFNQSVLVSLDGRDKDKKWYRLGKQDRERINYAISVTVLSFLDDKLKFDIGAVPEEEEAIALVSYKIFSLKTWTKIPIIRSIDIEPYGFIGSKRIENLKEWGEFDKGYGVKIVPLRW